MKIGPRIFIESLLTLVFLGGQLTTLAQTGSWAEEAPMPTARYGPPAAVINGQFYVVGGAVVYNSPPYPRFTNLEAYNPVSNTWSELAPIPIGVYSAAAGAINGELYVAGGSAAQNQGNNIATLQIYNPSNNTWTNGTSMPAACSGSCGGVINGMLYVACGDSPDNTSQVKTFVVYDPTSDTWTQKAPLPFALAPSAAGAGIVNGILYVVGGVTTGGITNSMAAYDPTSDTWTMKSPMPTARYGLAVGVINGILYAIGGISQTQPALNVVEAYDPKKDSWASVSSMPTARYFPAIGNVNGVLYVVGGGSPSTSNLATNEAFTPLPQLNIASTGNKAILFWDASATNYVLQSTTNLSSPYWVTASDAVPVIAFTVTNTSPARFFRLQQQQ